MPSSYEILGLQENATPAEIKSAYHALAKTHHPDKGGDAAKFREINEAYQNLTNTEFHAAEEKESQRSETVFGGIPVAAFNSMMRSIDNSSKTPPEDNYGELLKTNSLLTNYVKTILQAHDAGITHPALVLRKMLAQYVETKETLVTQVQYTLFSNLLNRRLAAELKEDVLNPHQPLEAALRRLDSAVISPEPRFIELFNAFFSIYPLYYHSMLTNENLKRQLRLIPLDDMYWKTIIEADVKKSDNDPDALNGCMLEDEVNQILVTNRMDFQIEKEMKSIEAQESHQRFAALHRLKRITKYANTKQLTQKIFPFILKMTKENSQIRNSSLDFCYSILNACMSVLDVAIIRQEVLPVLLDRFDKGLFHDTKPICSALCETARALEPSDIANQILPRILIFAQHKAEYCREHSYESIHKLISLLPARFLEAMILPALINGVSDSSAKVFKIVHAAFRDIVFLAQAESNDASEQVIYCRAAEKIKMAMQSYLDSVLKNVITEDLNEKVNAFHQLGNILAMAENKLLQEDIFPFIRKNCQNKEVRIRKAAYALCDAFVHLPEDKVTAINKKILLDDLLARVREEELKISIKAYSIIGDLIGFAENPKTIDNLLSDLLKCCTFSYDQNAYLSDKEDFNKAVLKALCKVIPYADPVRIENEVFPRLFQTIKFTTYGCADGALPVFQAAMNRVSLDYLKNKVFPRLYAQIGFSASGATKFINNIVERFTYPERVWLTRLLMKDFETKQFDKSAKIEVLVKIYQLNQAELSPHKELEMGAAFYNSFAIHEDYKAAGLRA